MASTSKQQSIKKLKIDKANSTIIAITAVAAFLVVFSLFASKTLISQMSYQNRVLSAKHAAVEQLKTNIGAISNLTASYKAFISTPQNMIGGNPSGSGPQDGNNALLTLDALPGQYDFPGLVSSLQKMLSNQGYTVTSIAGTDAQLTQGGNQSSGDPTPQQIPFSISVEGPYSSIQTLINTMQASIRPMVIQTVDLSGQDSDMTADITAYTYYQPQKIFTIGSEIVK